MIYNPLRTKLVLTAQKLHIPACGGLTMLVEQARCSAEMFLGNKIPEQRTAEILHQLELELENIVLIGMPGCGKSSIGAQIAQLMQREFIDFDQYISQKIGLTPEEIILNQGEATFRSIESEVAAEIGKRQGLVIATGGGTVTRDVNMLALRQNGRIYFIERGLSSLATAGRPLSDDGKALSQLYQQRYPLYRHYADAIIDNNESLAVAVQTILALICGGRNENFGN